MMLINVVGGVVGLLMVVVVGLPEPASWPFLFSSMIVHQAYYAALILGYRYGDLSDVYPIARGIAPLLVAAGAVMYAGETLRVGEMAAVALICSGIVSLGLTRQWSAASKRALIFALLTGISIALYTVIDGLGVRRAGNAMAYIGLLFALESVPITLFVLATRYGEVRTSIMHTWRTGLIGGVLAVSAYGIVIWAMNTSYLTFVSSLRETSVVLAALIGTILLKEPFGRRRLVSAVVVVLGVFWLHIV